MVPSDGNKVNLICISKYIGMYIDFLIIIYLLPILSVTIRRYNCWIGIIIVNYNRSLFLYHLSGVVR